MCQECIQLEQRVTDLERKLKNVNKLAELAAFLHIEGNCPHSVAEVRNGQYLTDRQNCNHPAQLFGGTACNVDTCKMLPPNQQ